MCSEKKKRLIIEVSICEQSKLSNSVATGKNSFLAHQEGFLNSLKCQVFSVACHWLLMVVPQMCLTQLEPEAEELISSVQNHASCALQTQDGKSLKPSSWSWAPSPGIGGRDVGW